MTINKSINTWQYIFAIIIVTINNNISQYMICNKRYAKNINHKYQYNITCSYRCRTNY